MKTDELKSVHILAKDGKVFRRISDRQIFGKEASLGYTYYIAGELLPTPLLELPEHYEEIDEPISDDIPILNEDTALLATSMELDKLSEEMATTIEELPEQSKRVTIADYRELEKKVEMLMKTII